MPAAGWYPDPDGERGRYRYWDGRTWTAITTTDPRTPPSGLGPPTAGAGPPPRRRRTGRLVALVVVVVAVIIAVVAGFAIFGPRGEARTEPQPSSTISSYDDGKTGSPTPTATPSSPAATTSASGDPRSARAVACDRASPDQEPAPPQDGRVHGGPLSFPVIPSQWEAPEATSRVPYSRDSQVQILVLDEELPWQASAQVGITTFAPFPGGTEATEEMLECVLTSDFYTSVDVTLKSNAVHTQSVSGRRATIRDAVLTFSHPQLKTKGSALRFVIVESDPVSYFFSAVPVERTDLIARIDAATGSLRVD